MTNHGQRPPYPRLGECYRVLSVALDTKAGNREVDRLAREGDYDWASLAQVGGDLIVEPLRKYADAALADVVAEWLEFMRDDYRDVVFGVTLASLGREETLPILIAEYFVPHGVNLLREIQRRFGGPDIAQLLSAERHPVAVVMEWLEHDQGTGIAKLAFADSTRDRSQRENVEKWARGTHLPQLVSVKLFADRLASNGVPAKTVSDAKCWLVVARALAFLDAEAGTSIRQLMLRYLLSGEPATDVRSAILAAEREVTGRAPTLESSALQLYVDLRRTIPKNAGDQARTREQIDAFSNRLTQHDPRRNGAYHVEWMNARWHVLSGRLSESLEHYERAADLGHYRAGSQEKPLLEEALTVAAFLKDKDVLKRLKHRAVSAGLFFDPRTAVVEDWELDQLAGQFDRLFPETGRFKEAAALQNQPRLEFLAGDLESLMKLKPQLDAPDRVRAVRFLDGQSRRYPQLQLFASIGRSDAVATLLSRGASVNSLDKAGASALLAALQRAIDTGDRACLELLLQYEHSSDTLNRVTAKKRLTPLRCAVQLGDPDVVARILAMGASPDLRAGAADETALYYAMETLGAVLDPSRVRKRLLESFFRQPDHVQRDTLRRYGASLAGVFGDGPERARLLADARHQEVLDAVVTAQIKGMVARHTPAKLVEVAEHLCRSGANPNMPHGYPAPGRTPLMLVAENGSGPAFDLLLRYGGDPFQPDEEGVNCIQIAMGFGSADVFGCLRARGLV